MLRAYREAHPLSEEECQIVYADLMFPHLFYGLSSKYFNKRAEWNQDLMEGLFSLSRKVNMHTGYNRLLQ